MSDAVIAAFGVTEADLLGSGWESTIYALGSTQVLRIPRPGVNSEDQVRAQAAFMTRLPPLPFAVPRIREISKVDGQLYVIEDRIAGQSMSTLLPSPFQETGARPRCGPILPPPRPCQSLLHRAGPLVIFFGTSQGAATDGRTT